MNKLIGFGASTMQGVGDSQGGFFKRLDAKLAKAGKPRECLNFGIGGNSTSDMLARFDEVRPHLPNPAIILLGSNDLPRKRDLWPQNRLSLADYSTNVKTILSDLFHPRTIFVSSFRVCPRRTGIQPETYAEYMGTALKIAASLRLITWDLYDESAALGDKYLASDGLHYNDAGHEFVAERLLEMIDAQ